MLEAEHFAEEHTRASHQLRAVQSHAASDMLAVLIGPVTVPTGRSVFPREIERPSRRWAEPRFANSHWWDEPAKGVAMSRRL